MKNWTRAFWDEKIERTTFHSIIRYQWHWIFYLNFLCKTSLINIDNKSQTINHWIKTSLRIPVAVEIAALVVIDVALKMMKLMWFLIKWTCKISLVLLPGCKAVTKLRQEEVPLKTPPIVFSPSSLAQNGNYWNNMWKSKVLKKLFSWVNVLFADLNTNKLSLGKKKNAWVNLFQSLWKRLRFFSIKTCRRLSSNCLNWMFLWKKEEIEEKIARFKSSSKSQTASNCLILLARCLIDACFRAQLAVKSNSRLMVV